MKFSGPDESQHNHPADHEEVQALRIVAAMKKKALDEPDVPPIQITSSINNIPASVLAHMPHPLAMVRTLQRNRATQFPTNPRTMDDLKEIPAKYRVTLADEDFLLYDSYDFIADDDVPGRVIVYATEQNLKMLGKSKTWFLDGTFKVSPNIFYQVFIILGSVEQEINRKKRVFALPFVYALLTSKEEVKSIQ